MRRNRPEDTDNNNPNDDRQYYATNKYEMVLLAEENLQKRQNDM